MEQAKYLRVTSVYTNILKLFISGILFIHSYSLYSQIDISSKIVNATFPNSWDKNRDLRGRKGQILAWVHFKFDNQYENKNCIVLFTGSDSLGNIQYFISEMRTDKKPFNKWNYGLTRYENYFTSSSGMKFGYWDGHLQILNHKPTEEELYALLKKWQFVFFENNPAMIEAGLDDKLWLSAFGFLPNRKLLAEIK